MNPATEAQLKYIRGLYRKVKLYYNTITDDNQLDARILQDDGINIATLTLEEAKSKIAYLIKQRDKKRF